jgi:hypothetical protein
MFPGTTGFGWNGTRYYDLVSGQFVAKEKVIGGLEDMIDAGASNMNTLTQMLINQEISLENWQLGMMEEIRITHAASAALSQGGWAQMTPADWGYEGSLVKKQYDYLADFANEIATGKQPLDGRALVRSDLYADASNTTYSAMTTRSYVADGWEEERRILEPGADHCDDCEYYEKQGWQPIGSLPEPGDDSQCSKRCRCTKQYRYMDYNGEWIESE